MRYLLCCVLLLPGLASAEIYRWTDAQGRVHFEQRAVAGSTPVAVKPQVVERDAATVEREQRTARFYDARRQENTKAEQVANEQRAKQSETCNKLRSQLASIAPGIAYYTENDKGERKYFTDAELDTTRRQLNQRLSHDCG